jgi:hypothetical protein
MLEYRIGDAGVEATGPIRRQGMKVGDDIDIGARLDIDHGAVRSLKAGEQRQRVGRSAGDCLRRAEFNQAPNCLR